MCKGNMMQISVEGFSKKKTDELVEAVQFFAKQLMHGKMVNNLTIDIEKCHRLDVMGECINEDDTKNPRWFTINLRDSKDDEDIIKTLAHEMVHVKQYAKNELAKADQWVQYATARGKHRKKCVIKSVWMGEIWKPSTKENEYWDCPWEIEAYGREVGLYHKWVKRCNAQRSKRKCVY